MRFSKMSTSDSGVNNLDVASGPRPTKSVHRGMIQIFQQQYDLATGWSFGEARGRLNIKNIVL